MAIKIVDMEYVEIDGKIVGGINAAFSAIVSGGESSEYIRMMNLTAELQKELVAWAANLRSTYQRQTEDAAKHARAQVETVQEKMTSHAEGRRKAEADRDFHRERADIAVQLAEHCMHGTTEAAVAVLRESRRIELAGKMALIDAEKAAMTAT